MLDPWSLSAKRWRKRLYMAVIERRVIQGASAILFTTEAERDLAQETGLPLPRPMIAPLGADPMPGDRAVLAERFLARHPRLAGQRIVIFLGRLHPKKRPELAIKVLPSLGGDLEDVHLVLAGAGEDAYVAELARLAEAGGVGDRVHMAGHLDGEDKWSALAAADVFVLPSHQENFGIAVAEAMQAGLPVVLSRGVNIWSEVVSAGAGLVLDEANPDTSLTQALLELFQNPGNLTIMGRRAQDHARKLFDWTKCSCVTADIYAKIGRGSNLT
jgi:glycosyltransferase involved in cell wall biosynthesis